MPRLLPYVLLLLFFPLSGLDAADLWTIGTDDNSHAEFAISGNHSEFTKLFPKDAEMKVDCLQTQKEWPFILPGPHDAWSGSKSHVFTLVFDYLGTPKDEPEALAFQLELKGWGQGGSPALLDVKLNGMEKSVQTTRNPKGDTVLTDTKKTKSDSFNIVFPANAVKQGENRISIGNKSGSWFIFDCVKFSTKTGKISKITLAPVRGIFRTADVAIAERKFTVDYDGDVLATPMTLEVKMSSKGQEPTTFKKQLDPKTDFEKAEIGIPLTKDDAVREYEIEAALKTQGDAITAKCKLPAERKYEIFLVHQTHLDIGYTHTQEDVLKRQVQSIRDALKYIDETKNYPDEAKFRYHPEGMWAIDEFLKSATPEEKASFLKAAQSRQFHLDAMYAQAMTGMYNDEELFELLGSAVRFGKEHGITIDSAMQTDVPGYTWGLVTALGQNGIKYMSMGPNGGHRVGRLYYWGEKPFYWESQSGKEKVLCWLLDTGYHQFHGKPVGHKITEAEIFNIIDGKDWLTGGNESRRFPFDIVMLRYGIEGDNGRPNRVLSDVVKEWNEKLLYPKLIISTNSAAMAELEKRHGKELPTFKGDITPHWEDGCISTTEATSINRRACEKILQAQTLWAMFAPESFPVQKFDEAYTNLIMYDEHTWGAYNSISEPDSNFVKRQDNFKQNYARTGSKLTDELFLNAIPQDSKGNTNAVLVVNTTTRARGDFVVAPWNESLSSLKDAAEKDGMAIFARSGEDMTPCQITDDGLCFYASFIPPFGNKRFEIVVPPDQIKPISAVQTDPENGTITNGLVSLKIDPKSGAIVSMKRKGSDHEFVNPGEDGNAGLNDYLYIIGRDAKKNRERYEGGVKLAANGSGVVFAELSAEAKVPNCRSLKRTYRLYAGSDSIEILNVMDKEKERRPEGTFFGFPFNVPEGKWFIDIPWSLAEVEKDQLPGANRNYYCMQRYALLANNNIGVDFISIDANMLQFSPILYAPAWDRSLKSWREKIDPNGTIYSWVCSNHWETNYKADQEGILKFKYVICPYEASTENSIAQNMARESHQPLIAINASKATTAPAPLLEIGNDWITVSSLRPARDGSGDLIVRFFNPSDREESVSPKFNGKKSVFTSNPLEEKSAPLTAPIRLAPKETMSVRACAK